MPPILGRHLSKDGVAHLHASWFAACFARRQFFPFLFREPK
jgi:hypothetical protein